MCLTTQIIQKLIYVVSLVFPGTAPQADEQTGVMSNHFRILAEHSAVCML